ncbi:MAG: hypothetical protein ACRDAU_06425 [Clostridium sp.]
MKGIPNLKKGGKFLFMKKFLQTTLTLLILSGLTSLTATAATSKGGHYYYGNGSIILVDSPWDSYTNCHAIAESSNAKITSVRAIVKTNGAINKSSQSRTKAEVWTRGSVYKNQAITGTSDNVGYKEIIHHQR